MTAGTEDLLDEVRHHRALRIRAAQIRRDAHVTQARMAQALGVNRTTLARWESGAAQPHQSQRDRWTQLVEALEVELAGERPAVAS